MVAKNWLYYVHSLVLYNVLFRVFDSFVLFLSGYWVQKYKYEEQFFCILKITKIFASHSFSFSSMFCGKNTSHSTYSFVLAQLGYLFSEFQLL